MVVHSIESAADPLMPAMRQLIRDFLTELNVDMQYQAVEEELAQRTMNDNQTCPPSPSTLTSLSPRHCSSASAAVPGKYSAASQGCMLIAVDASASPPTPLGCVMLRSLDYPVGEVKRMFVAPSARRLGVGRLMMRRLFDLARSLGYSVLRLDTLVRLPAANALYKALGFYTIPAYCYNPFDDAVFLEIALHPEQQQQGTDG